MKIVSDFVDYYDHAQDSHHGAKPLIIYMRKTRIVDMLVALKVQEELGVGAHNLKCFSDLILHPTWVITPFLVGVGGRFNRGVEIKYGKEIDYAYTLTGARFISKRMGIVISEELDEMLQCHFVDAIFDMPSIFKMVGAPAFVIAPDTYGFVWVTANPCLLSLGYYKACLGTEIYFKIKNFIDTFLLPCEDVKQIIRPRRTETKIIGLPESGWSFNESMPAGY